MWPFKRKPESPQEIAAEERLDEVTRAGGPDRDPADDRSLRDVLHEGDAKN